MGWDVQAAFASMCTNNDVPVHPWSQRFVDGNRESRYRRTVFDDHIAPNFTLILLSLIATAITLSVMDWFVVPDQRVLALWLRLGVIVPAFIGFALYSRSSGFGPTQATAASVTGVAGVIAFFFAVGAAAQPPGSWLYLAYPIIFTIGTPPLARWPVRTTAAFNVAAGAGALVAIAVERPPLEVTVFLVVSHMVAGVYGVLAALFVERVARRAFVQQEVIQLQRERADTLLFDVLPAPIAERLKAGESDIAEAHDDVAVLFADLVGFTPLSERVQPQVVVATLNALFTAFDDAVERRTLEKIKTVGDAYMAAAGLPFPRADAVEAMVGLAFELRDIVAAMPGPDGPLTVRIGIHVGPVVAGVIGRRRFVYDLWGDTVNVAARMESHGEPGRVHVTDAVRAGLPPQGYTCTPRGDTEVKGKGAMSTYWLEPATPA